MAGLWLMFFRKAKPDDLKYAKNSDRIAREAAEAKAAESKGEAKTAKEPERDATAADD